MILALHHIYFTSLFIVTFSKFIKPHKLFYYISYICIFIFSIIIAAASKFADFIYYNGTWRFNQVEVDNVSLFAAYWILYLIILIFGVVLLIKFYRSSVSMKEKKQAVVVLTTFCITAFLLFCYMVFVVHYFKIISYTIPADASLFFIIWGVGATYAIIKYRFLVLSPNMVSSEILANIDELILLLDFNLHIISGNLKTAGLLIANPTPEKNFLDYIREGDVVAKEIESLLQLQSPDFSCRINFKTETDYLLADAKFKLIRDRFDDIIGIMVIAKEVKEVKQLQHLYKITSRETEIVQLLISGMPNKEIAENLQVAETTLKRHITNIYNKLAVGNKVELINLLKDFNIIPEKSASRTVVVFE